MRTELELDVPTCTHRATGTCTHATAVGVHVQCYNGPCTLVAPLYKGKLEFSPREQKPTHDTAFDTNFIAMGKLK